MRMSIRSRRRRTNDKRASRSCWTSRATLRQRPSARLVFDGSTRGNNNCRLCKSSPPTWAIARTTTIMFTFERRQCCQSKAKRNVQNVEQRCRLPPPVVLFADNAMTLRTLSHSDVVNVLQQQQPAVGRSNFHACVFVSWG